MPSATLTMSFVDDDGTERRYQTLVPVTSGSDADGERRISENLGADFIVSTQQRPAPIHNETARQWLTSPGASYDFAIFDDVNNSQELWRELCNLVLSAEHDLGDAFDYKALEQPERPDIRDDAALEQLYYVHRQKMDHLNRCAANHLKVQDLVNRLLHEALGGTLIPTDGPKWEKGLTRDKIRKGLDEKVVTGTLSSSDRQLIEEALRFPEKAFGHETVVRYRNRLAHHVNPSVDYPMFYSQPRSRAFSPNLDEHGNVVSMSRVFYATAPLDYTFDELHSAYLAELDAIVAMLNRLSAIPLIHR